MKPKVSEELEGQMSIADYEGVIPAKGHRQTKEKTDVPEGKEPADELKMKRILTERLQSGTTVHELAAEFKISKQEMFQKLQELGIKTKAFRPM